MGVSISLSIPHFHPLEPSRSVGVSGPRSTLRNPPGRCWWLTTIGSPMEFLDRNLWILERYQFPEQKGLIPISLLSIWFHTFLFLFARSEPQIHINPNKTTLHPSVPAQGWGASGSRSLWEDLGRGVCNYPGIQALSSSCSGTHALFEKVIILSTISS